MKEFKKMLSIIICMSMITAMFACGVSAAETSTEETAEVETSKVISEVSETSTETAAEVPDTETETTEEGVDEIVTGTEEELPAVWYHIPKEKMVFDGEFPDCNLEPLYAYVAIVVNDDYLEPNGISYEDYVLDCSAFDIERMRMDYHNALTIDSPYANLSYRITETYLVFEPDEYYGDPALSEAIMRAVYAYCITAGVDYEDFLRGTTIENIITPENVTFSEERLHYFDD